MAHEERSLGERNRHHSTHRNRHHDHDDDTWESSSSSSYFDSEEDSNDDYDGTYYTDGHGRFNYYPDSTTEGSSASKTGSMTVGLGIATGVLGALVTIFIVCFCVGLSSLSAPAEDRAQPLVPLLSWLVARVATRASSSRTWMGARLTTPRTRRTRGLAQPTSRKDLATAVLWLSELRAGVASARVATGRAPSVWM